MATAILTLHLMLAAGLVAVVLLQRSEGGGLGIGGSGAGGFMTGRGTANFLTRLTAGLAAAFFVTSLSLTLLSKQSARPISPLDLPASSRTAPASAPQTPAPSAPAKSEAPAPAVPATPEGGVLKSLEGGRAPLPKSQ